MHIEINPRSLLNLEQICEILYKLHPSVLDFLVDMQRSTGCILGCYNTNNLSFEQREKITEFKIVEKDDNKKFHADKKLEEDRTDDDDDYNFKKLVNMMHGDGDYPEDIFVFNRLLKYLQHDTDEYIPIKINIEIEDPVIGRKVRELIRALEKTNAPEQFYLNKREIDSEAYFAEGYGLTMNEEQKKKEEDLFSKNDPEELKKLLIKEKLYYY